MPTLARRVFTAALIPAALVPVLMLSLAGCAPTVPLTPAPDAANPDCADVTVRLPTSIAGLEKRETNAQATGAWGSPASILLFCGVEVPGPSTLICVTLRGIDWLRDDSKSPNFVFTSYGRDPAVQVVIDGTEASGTDALEALSNAVSTIPANRACTDPYDGFKIPEISPSPSPSP